ASTPGRDTIVARLVGGPLAVTGVIAGMSGRPVYIDGKLVGAVSSGYLSAKDAIAGITPIAEMLDLRARNWANADSRGFYLAGPDATARALESLERHES